MTSAQNMLTSLKRLAVSARRRLRGDRPREFVIADVPANPKTAMCNICGFTPAGDRPRICPRCNTNQRQRSFRQIFAAILEREVFREGILGHALFLSPGLVELSLLRSKFHRSVVSSLYQDFLAEASFVRADVRDLAPFADGQFDYVQACNVLDYVPEMQRAIAAVHRVLRRGGYFVFLVPETTLAEGDAALAVSVHASVTGNYWPDKTSVPLVSVGRATLADMLRETGFQPHEIRVIEPLSARPCTWWVCRRA